MEAWRICAARFASDPLSGVGAYLYGGRWNSQGVHLAYAALSRALCILEMRVHLSAETAPTDHVLIPIEVDDDLVAELDPATLPQGWRRFPAPPSLAGFGDAWVRGQESLGLVVPSAVVPEESNLLLNPRHPRMDRVRVGPAQPVQYDPRLFG
jgi:RES domain-containing protein